jgi:hypothetical protein
MNHEGIIKVSLPYGHLNLHNDWIEFSKAGQRGHGLTIKARSAENAARSAVRLRRSQFLFARVRGPLNRRSDEFVFGCVRSTPTESDSNPAFACLSPIYESALSRQSS